MAHDQIGPPDKAVAGEESFGDGSGGVKTLTSSWVEGAAVNVKRRSNVTVRVHYVKGSETLALLRIMGGKGAESATATFVQAGELEAASSGRRPLVKGEISLAPGSYAADDWVDFDVSVPTMDWIRTDAKYSGGSSPGSIYTEIIGGWGL